MSVFTRKSDRAKALYERFVADDERQSADDMRALLQEPPFRRFLVRTLKRSRVFGSLAQDAADPNAALRAIGYRELGVDIYMDANRADGAMVLKAIAERNDIERERIEQFQRETQGERK